MDLTEAWKAWKRDGNQPRRELLIQIINALHLSRKWESYSKAVENMKFSGCLPADASNMINEAIRIATQGEWKPGRCRTLIQGR